MSDRNFVEIFTRALSQAQSGARSERPEFPISEIILSQLEPGKNLSGKTREMVDECLRQRNGTLEFEGTPMPWCALKMTRDMTVGTFGQGGAMVQTDVAPAVIELLYNRTAALRLGVTPLTDLRGPLTFSRQTGAVVTSSLPETAAVNASSPTFDQISLTPKRVSVAIVVSKQLFLQSAISIEKFLRNEIVTKIGVEVDRLILNGQGAASEPLGIMNTPGVGSLVLGGAATFPKLVSMEGQLAGANADTGKLGYLTTTATRSTLKSAAMTLTGATTVSSRAIWEPMNDGTNDGIINGYRAAASNNVPNNQIIFGNFADCLFAQWGPGLDIQVNPYSLDIQGQFRFVAHLFFDVALRHPQSFCVTADAGNQ